LTIQQSAISLPELESAERVMVYVGSRSEVETRHLIDELLRLDKTLFVPWCDGDELRLFRLQSINELQPGAFGIPEPKHELRLLPDRQIDSAKIDVVFLPGLAFDAQGGRLGQGKGYYDRLLESVSQNCILIGLAFDVQLIEEVPTEPHDIKMDLIVTESEVIRCPPV